MCIHTSWLRPGEQGRLKHEKQTEFCPKSFQSCFLKIFLRTELVTQVGCLSSQPNVNIEISRLSREINESLELPAGLGSGNDSESAV